MVDRDDRVTDTERTTVVHTDGDRGRGNGLIIGIIALILVIGLLFFLFGGNFNRAADDVGVNVDVDTPAVQVPDVDVPEVKAPDIDMPDVNVNLPDVDVDTDGGNNQ